MFTIGRQEYLVLEGGPPRFTHERPSTRYSGDQPRSLIAFGYGALTLYGLPFQAGSPNDQIFDFARIREDPKVDSYNPETATAPAYHAVAVWTVPFSLATTQGIDIFSSSYLDVSVRWLTFGGLCIQPPMTGHYPSRVSPFGHLRITVCSRLPEAFRSLPRPSSALGAKAST